MKVGLRIRHFRQIIGLFIICSCIAHSSHAYNTQLDKQITVKLFCDGDNKDLSDLLCEAAEYQLLLHEQINTNISNINKNNIFLYHQRLSGDKFAQNKDRYKIVSALYNKFHRSIYYKIEYINNLNRAKIMKRAQQNSLELTQALRNKQETLDPFLLQAQLFSSINITQPNVKKNSLELSDSNLYKKYASNQFIFALGFETYSLLTYPLIQPRYSLTYTPYPIVNLGYERVLNSYISLALEAHSAIAMPWRQYNFPEIKNYPIRHRRSVLKSNFAWQFWAAETSFLKLKFNFKGEFLSSNAYVQTNLKNTTNIFNLNEGVSLEFTHGFDLLESRLGILLGVAPFVQNFAIKSFVPVKNFAWHGSLYGESRLYRWFYLRLNLEHEGVFHGPQNNSHGVVSLANIAYLGLVIKSKVEN